MKDARSIEEFSPGYYFPGLQDFNHAPLFGGLNEVWEAVARLRVYVASALSGEIASTSKTVRDLAGARLIPLPGENEKVRDGILSSEGYILCEEDVYLERIGIVIGEGTIVEPGVVIKSPAIIGRNAELRHGAYLRGSVIIGDASVVGHATEVKNSVFMDYAEAGHFAYVGDSILGQHVNLGAGTKLANLELRSAREKESRTIRPITITVDGRHYDTGLRKLGAILGDNVETGCNSVTSPASLIGHGSWVYANTTVKKGVYARNVVIRNYNGKMDVVTRRES